MAQGTKYLTLKKITVKKFLKPFFGVIILCIIAGIVIQFTLGVKVANKYGALYTITIGSKHPTTYLSGKIIKQDERCITFMNVWGNEQTVCGDYISFTKATLSVDTNSIHKWVDSLDY